MNRNRVPQHLIRLITLWVCMWGTYSFAADLPTSNTLVVTQLTRTPAETARCKGEASMFRQEMALLKPNALLNFDLNTINDIPVNSHNWGGVDDASLICDIGFTPNAIVVAGQLRDDVPFFQTTTKPMRERNKSPYYCADGVEFIFEDMTSSTRRVIVTLDFSSGCTNPRLMLCESISPETMGCITEAYLHVTPSATQPTNFEFTIPYEYLADPRFFNIPLKVTTRLHDLDGELSGYLMMEAIKNKL